MTSNGHHAIPIRSHPHKPAARPSTPSKHVARQFLSRWKSYPQRTQRLIMLIVAVCVLLLLGNTLLYSQLHVTKHQTDDLHAGERNNLRAGKELIAPPLDADPRGPPSIKPVIKVPMPISVRHRRKEPPVQKRPAGAAEQQPPASDALDPVAEQEQSTAAQLPPIFTSASAYNSYVQSHTGMSPSFALWAQPIADASDNYCAAMFGNGHVEHIPLCAPAQSSLDCYRSPTVRNMVCHSQQLEMDLTQVKVSYGGEAIDAVPNRNEDDEYPKYAAGTFRVQCAANSGLSIDGNTFPHHLRDVMQAVTYAPTIAGRQCLHTIAEPTFFVTRYEYANIYHTMGDWYNTYQLVHMLDIDPLTTPIKIVFLDGHSSGAIDDAWVKLFGTAPVYIRHLAEQLGVSASSVCFSNAYFVSPAYKSALSIDLMNAAATNCQDMPQVADFSRHWHRAFASSANDGQLTDLMNKQHTITPSSRLATLIFRRDYIAHPRQGGVAKASRKVANENEVYEATVNTLAGTDLTAVAVDFAQLSVAQQIQLIKQTHLLISVHGAALSYVLLLPPQTTVIELIPSDYNARVHFQYFARYTPDLFYTPINLPQGVGNVGENGGLTVPIDALTRGLQMAKADIAAPVAAVATTPAPTAPAQTVDPFPDALPAEPMELDIVQQYKSYTQAMSPLPTFNPPQHKLCLLVPFRDSAASTSQGAGRTKNLQEFIPYMTKWLQQNGGRQMAVDAHILIVEQSPTHVFNKGALFNAGFMYSAVMEMCDYMVLHDVDQIPETPANDYAWYDDTNSVLHMCSASSQFGYQMAYEAMVGGALMIKHSTYQRINGYSNYYWGWGQEDDDLYFRLQRTIGANNVRRLPVTDGMYTALGHTRVKDLDVTPIFNQGRKHLQDTQHGVFDIQTDGLSDLQAMIISQRELQPGVQQITVDFRFDDMPMDLSQVHAK